MIITKEWVKAKGACGDAYKWAAPKLGENGLSLAECIRGMNRADWLMWLLYHSKSVTIRQMVWLSCKVGRLSLRHVPTGEDRPRLAYEAAEAWVLNPTDTAGDARAAGDAARVAGDAARVAGAAAWAAGAAGDARAAEHKKMCAIIRKELRKKSFKDLARGEGK